LTDAPRGVLAIDLFGLQIEQVRERFPAVFQWLLERVKPERDHNNRATYRDNWWIFGEPRRQMRPALVELNHFIATTRTAKHHVFQLLDVNIIPESKIVALCPGGAYFLGVLSSSVHVIWAVASGGWLGVWVGRSCAVDGDC